jgi:hypothetical protein
MMETAVRLEDTRSVRSIIDPLLGRQGWDQLLEWPPDVFAVAATLLGQSGAFRFVVSPPPNKPWPPAAGWRDRVVEAARSWAQACSGGDGRLPDLLVREWKTLTVARDAPIDVVSSSERWDLCTAIITLQALADEACARMAVHIDDGQDTFEKRAWQRLADFGSLSRLPRAGIRVLPKTHLAAGGISLRSLSRYLAIHTGQVEVAWKRVPVGDMEQRGQGTAWNILLLPWPLEVASSDFRVVPGPLYDMKTEASGFFEFDPHAALDLGYVEGALKAAIRVGAPANAVVLPEAALLADEVVALEELAVRHGAMFLAAGVRQPADPATTLARSYAQVSLWNGEGWIRFQANKHHRWSLDASQIHQYHLGKVLSPKKRWWEAIAIPARRLPILDVGGGATTSVLICEDLARLDEVAEVLRNVGPTFVIALLQDGPQIASRWSCRYAGVLADDPGSSVLTLTSLGMATRCRPRGSRPSRAVALWKDPERGLQEIALQRGAMAAVLMLEERRKTVWTADGRWHLSATPSLLLRRIAQIR